MSRWLAAFRGEAEMTAASRPENPEKGEKPPDLRKLLTGNEKTAGIFGTTPSENSPKPLGADGGERFSGDRPGFSGGAVPKTPAKNGPKISSLEDAGRFSPFSGFSGGRGNRAADGAALPSLHPDDDPNHQAWIEDVRRAASRQPPLLPTTAPPGAGCYCTCCAGQVWWCELVELSSWRCCTRYRPLHLTPEAVCERRT